MLWVSQIQAMYIFHWSRCNDIGWVAMQSFYRTLLVTSYGSRLLTRDKFLGDPLPEA